MSASNLIQPKIVTSHEFTSHDRSELYGWINEDMEFQMIEKLDSSDNIKSITPKKGRNTNKVYLTATEVVSVTQNMYYHL